MSRKGNCWDNAVAESFFHTLKGQCVRGQVFTSIEQARLVLFEYIEIYYDRRRLHSANNWDSPQNYENKTIINMLLNLVYSFLLQDQYLRCKINTNTQAR